MEAFLRLLMVHVHGRRLWVGPKVVVAVPHMLSDMEVRVVRETFEKAGAREVEVVERPIAAALGVGLPIEVVRAYAAQLVVFLEYLHSELEVCHRDLKPGNIMIGDNLYLKIVSINQLEI